MLSLLDFIYAFSAQLIWFLFNFLMFLMIFAAFMVVFSSNPINSVLYLILLFVSTAFSFIMLGAEFLGITLIIVYVGAIAVLFLFAVMMLNINKSEFVGFDFYFFFSLVLVICFFYFLQTIVYDGVNFIHIFSNSQDFYLEWVNLLIWKNNVEVIGSILYTYYAHLFILSSLILLIAMIASIVLTLGRIQPKHSKLQDKYKQIEQSVGAAVRLRG
jgi:NADH-quinone oxidoreductase subunit J